MDKILLNDLVAQVDKVRQLERKYASMATSVNRSKMLTQQRILDNMIDGLKSKGYGATNADVIGDKQSDLFTS